MNIRNKCIIPVLLIAVFTLFGQSALTEDGHYYSYSHYKSKLAVVWTSGDPDVAHRVCFMYTHNAKLQGWFNKVNLIVWGPSARLLAGDKDLQAKIKEMMDDGVVVQACKACADSYGVSEKFEELSIEVKYMGVPLTNMLKRGWKVLTF